jgi:hypothetical protein
MMRVEWGHGIFVSAWLDSDRPLPTFAWDFFTGSHVRVGQQAVRLDAELPVSPLNWRKRESRHRRSPCSYTFPL